MTNAKGWTHGSVSAKNKFEDAMEEAIELAVVSEKWETSIRNAKVDNFLSDAFKDIGLEVTNEVTSFMRQKMARSSVVKVLILN